MTKQSKMVLLTLLGALVTGCGDDVGSEQAEANESPKPLRGSQLSSQFVDDASWYLGRRNIALLNELGALDADQQRVARRADGIIDNLQPNGYLGAQELAELEKPENWNAMFPSEQAAVPKLWELLNLDAVNNVPSPCAFDEPVVQLVDEDVPRTSHVVDIPTLPADLQLMAQRIQLQFDSDDDETTLSGRDVFAANDNVAAYLPEEAAQLQALMDEVERTMTPPDPALPRWRVPDSACNTAVPTDDVSTSAFATPTFEGEWRVVANAAPTGPQVSFDHGVTFGTSQPDDRIVVFTLATGAETPQEMGNTIELGVPGRSQVRNTPGYRVELWRQGSRVQLFEFEFPNELPNEEPIRSFLPIELEAQGQILYPDFSMANRNDGGGSLRNKFVEHITFSDQPSAPETWRALTWDQNHEHLATFGSFSVYEESLEDAYQVILYEGGWAIIRTPNGALSAVMPPQFFRVGNPSATFDNIGIGVKLAGHSTQYLHKRHMKHGNYQAYLVPSW